jgi:phage/plasmid-associated DNA primase
VAYRDQVRAFIAEQCSQDPMAQVRGSELWAAYQSWCRDNGKPALSQTAFGRTLSSLAFHSRKSSARFRVGLSLRRPAAVAAAAKAIDDAFGR